MSDFCRSPEVKKAAKPHVCIYCCEPIPKGEHYTEQTGYWEGSAFRNRFHVECFKALCDSGDNEFTPYSEERPERAGGAA